MHNPKKFVVSHAPYWHIGSSIPDRNYNFILAALPAVLTGIVYFGGPALGVISLAVSTAVAWEALFNLIAKRENTIGDGNAVLIGLLLGMLLPATAPWWLVITGTFLVVVISKQIFGGIGANPFSPPVLAYAILLLSWPAHLDMNTALVNFDFNFPAQDPLVAVKAFGPDSVDAFSLTDMLLGRKVGGIGATGGLALIIGGLYLILRGYVRWEIPVSFIAGLLATAGMFYIVDPTRYASPLFHLLAGYSLIGAFFLITDDSSSPVNTLPMLIYGAAGGVMTILIRNIGAFPDGVIHAVLVINLINPLIDKIRPKALGKVVRQ